VGAGLWPSFAEMLNPALGAAMLRVATCHTKKKFPDDFFAKISDIKSVAGKKLEHSFTPTNNNCCSENFPRQHKSHDFSPLPFFAFSTTVSKFPRQSSTMPHRISLCSTRWNSFRWLFWKCTRQPIARPILTSNNWYEKKTFQSNPKNLNN